MTAGKRSPCILRGQKTTRRGERKIDIENRTTLNFKVKRENKVEKFTFYALVSRSLTKRFVKCSSPPNECH